MIIGKKEFDLNNKVYVMGILNVTPDSFSDGNTHNTLENALEHAKRMIDEGADIIDVGGESTRPGYTMISDDEEIERVIGIIKEIKRNFDIPVSIDTYKSKVAKAALEEGVDLINDIWGLKYKGNMAEVVSKYKVPICIMHNRVGESIDYCVNMKDDPMNTVIKELKESINIAHKYGINDDKIITDPGIGFAKTYGMNMHTLNNLERLSELVYPILLGASRKSAIGLTLNLPSNEREEGTVATSVLGIIKGASIIRVHNVLANKRAIKMVESIMQY